MGRRKQTAERNRDKALKHRMRRDRLRHGAGSFAPPGKLSNTLARQLDTAYDLIERRDYDAAHELLQRLDSRGISYPDVVEALLHFYQTVGDHEEAYNAAERFARLQPNDPAAALMLAQESMFCGHAGIALNHYQQITTRWPRSEWTSIAQDAIDILETEVQRRIEQSRFPEKQGPALVALHEEALVHMHRGDYEACAASCRKLVEQAPTFAPARNNLALVNFHRGRRDEAVSIFEETVRQLPGNRFAEASLAKFYFLTGRQEDAQRLADQIAADPTIPQQDAFIATLELFAFLGLDALIVEFATRATESDVPDADRQGMMNHFLAYAQCRLGDRSAARAAWRKCVKLVPAFAEAERNLDDLERNEGHAPWVGPLQMWIPKATFEELARIMEQDEHRRPSRFSTLAQLIPPLLDRGDPPGRELAMKLAMADGSPPMLNALRDFALGFRGPDQMRLEALQFLREKGELGSGPHRIYAKGEWRDVELLAAEITTEPVRSDSSPEALRLLADAIGMLQEDDFDSAEQLLNEVLALEPDNLSAAYNVCTIWMERDGPVGREKARARLEQLHRDHPNYVFATIALAQLIAKDGDHQKARDMLYPLMKLEKMHVYEAKALYSAQVHIALDEGNIDAAETSYQFLREFEDGDSPKMQCLRDLIDKASSRGSVVSRLASMLHLR